MSERQNKFLKYKYKDYYINHSNYMNPINFDKSKLKELFD